MLTLQISSSIRDATSERRFQENITVENLKGKLEMITGVMATMMDLEVYNNQNKFICKLNDDLASLNSYPLQNNMRLHVINKDPSTTFGEFDDVSKVEKYVMDQSEYEKKTDSVLAFKKQNKLGRFGKADPGQKEKKEEAEHLENEKAKSITPGCRCLVTRSGIPPRKGMVKFVGKTEFADGWWIGVQYDEPVGKNDGSVKGKDILNAPLSMEHL
ncbi:tubulin-folding cofactor B-like isoform X2 [Xenia sp. Carnegie-2017]|uniref:tubulin-folding cofactor B-like isoform X2 n=1 Tax=Xenia sp. Carnegie-2017 TaxID=2897299 RepID=UPI001F03DBE4|nr:tubulin-folding cofactor B-like isoform X2 [Xenia sp. Carnegie-2017]